jgi:hypothetical protein
MACTGKAPDVDLSIPGLLAGLFGTKSYMARHAGQARSAAKAAAAEPTGRRAGVRASLLAVDGCADGEVRSTGLGSFAPFTVTRNSTRFRNSSVAFGPNSLAGCGRSDLPASSGAHLNFWLARRKARANHAQDNEKGVAIKKYLSYLAQCDSNLPKIQNCLSIF